MWGQASGWCPGQREPCLFISRAPQGAQEPPVKNHPVGREQRLPSSLERQQAESEGKFLSVAQCLSIKGPLMGSESLQAWGATELEKPLDSIQLLGEEHAGLQTPQAQLGQVSCEWGGQAQEGSGLCPAPREQASLWHLCQWLHQGQGFPMLGWRLGEFRVGTLGILKTQVTLNFREKNQMSHSHLTTFSQSLEFFWD